MILPSLTPKSIQTGRPLGAAAIRPRRRAFTTAVFAAAAALSALLFAARFAAVGFSIAGDGLGYFAPARSLLFDGNLVVADEYIRFAAMHSRFQGGARWQMDIPQYSKYTVGMALVLAPAYLAAHAAMRLANWLGLPVPPVDGLSWPYEAAWCLGAMAVGIAGLVCVYWVARRWAGRRGALAATLGVWFASPLFYYLALEPGLSHAVSQGVVSAFLLVALDSDGRASWRRVWLLGALWGIAVLVRPQNALFGVVAVAMLAPHGGASGAWRGSAARLAVLFLAGSLIAALQAAVYRIEYGTVFGSPYFIEGNGSPYFVEGDPSGDGSFRWLHPRLIAVLFSPLRGLFFWHPLTLVGVCGLALAPRGQRRRAWALLAAVALQVYFVAAWHCWWQGASLGGRMFSGCALPFGFGLALLWRRGRGSVARRLMAGGVAFLILWNMLLVGQYLIGTISPTGPVAVRELLLNQVRVIPGILEKIGHRP